MLGIVVGDGRDEVELIEEVVVVAVVVTDVEEEVLGRVLGLFNSMSTSDRSFCISS